MATFTWTPDWSSSKKHSPRVRKFQFGDGYEQRTTDGLNTNPESWSVTFKRNVSEAEDIDDFLIARKAVEAFNWTTPKARAATFKCEEWNVVYDSPGWTTITATFVEVFEVVAA